MKDWRERRWWWWHRHHDWDHDDWRWRFSISDWMARVDVRVHLGLQLLRSHLGSVILGWCCVLVDGGGWLRIICSARAFAKVGILVLGIGGPVWLKPPPPAENQGAQPAAARIASKTKSRTPKSEATYVLCGVWVAGVPGAISGRPAGGGGPPPFWSNIASALACSSTASIS